MRDCKRDNDVAPGQSSRCGRRPGRAAGVTALTPLLHSPVLSDRLGGPVFLKRENLQRTGSFKPRGAYCGSAG